MKIKITLAVILCSFLIGGCYYDVEEELYGAGTCDTTNVTYTGTVSAIINNNGCLGCHGSPLNSGAPFSLQGYANLKANSGRLVGAIDHAPGFAPMPQGQPKMTQCDINKIKAWLNAGMPQ